MQNKTMIQQFYLKLLSEVRKNQKYFFFSLSLSIYVFFTQLIIAVSKKQLLTTIISITVLFLISKLSRIAFAIISFLILILTSIIFHLTQHWGGESLASRLQAALLSPSYEITEYLQTYLNTIDILVFLYVLVGIYLLFLYLRKFKHSYNTVKIFSSILLLVFSLGVHFTNYIQKIPPYSYIPKLLKANEYKSLLDKRTRYLKGIDHKQLTMQNNIPEYDKIVIILGESANKHHMGIYGYNIPTTPFLTELASQRGSYVFPNVIAPTNQTRYSVPILFTPANVHDFNKFFSSQSIISTFKEYGYKTYWLSNQYISGMADSYIASIASEADISKTMHFAYPPGGKEDTEFDMILVKLINNINIQKVKKEVYFIHLLGSHFQYKKRYPTGMGLFPTPKNKVEEYDNSIHYTDSVIKEIYNIFKNDKLLLIYISDHAEMVNIKKSGHGYNPPFGNEYDIPLFIHSSESNKRLAKIRSKNNKMIFNAESFNHIVQYITGIEVDDSKISSSTKIISLEPDKIIEYKTLIPTL